MTKNKKPASSGPQQTTMTIDQAIEAAYAHWRAGQLAQSEHLCQQILNVIPEQPQTLHLMGLLAHTQGKLALAIDFIGRACRSPQAPAMFFSNLAEMCRQAGDLSRGEVAGRRATELAPQSPEGWSNLGIILQESGKFDESLQCLLKTIALNPQNAQSHNNIANTYMRLGRFEDAKKHYQKATELAPDYSEAYNNLSFLLKEFGDLDGASEAIQRAIEINPHNIDAYINGAGIAVAREDIPQAKRWLNNLMSFAPDHPNTLMTQAKILQQCNELKEAENCILKVQDKMPQNGEAHMVYADILKARGKTDEALRYYDKAMTLPNPKMLQTLIGKTVLLIEMGEREEARKNIELALDRGGRIADTLMAYSQVHKFNRNDSLIEKMENMLVATGNDAPTPNEVTILNFILGKAYLDTNSPKKAFDHFAIGNAEKRKTYDYNADETSKWLKSITEIFTPELFKQFSGAGDPSQTPIFIVGIPRSGTTLTEQILASHPNIYGCGELKILSDIVDKTIQKAEIRAGFPDFMHKISPLQLAEMGATYVNEIKETASSNKPFLVDKMPANFIYTGLIHLMLPNARIIHCQRDPIDTSLSCYTRLFGAPQRFTYDLVEMGKFYNAYHEMMTYWHDVIPKDRLIGIQYEDMVDDQEGQTRRLLDFLGLEWDDACLEFHKTKRQVSTASFTQVREPIYRSSVQRWKKYARYLQPLIETIYPDGAPE